MSAHVSLGSHDQYEPHASFAHTAPLMMPTVSNTKPSPSERYAISSHCSARLKPAPAALTSAAIAGAPAESSATTARSSESLVSSIASAAAAAASASPSLSPPARRPAGSRAATTERALPTAESSGWSRSKKAPPSSEPTMSVPYENIITVTCMMSQLDLSAGTSAPARCRSGGSSSVAPASAASAAGAATAPGTIDLDTLAPR
mmetsp:Transcript_21162/g.65623  ORF Transcript_21162/g.65623 Transcript_21162/m.65623 type:complete len:204 (+) Transcript_21162:1150-1761(+)